MLILVRHGRTGHNASRHLLGRLDAPLDELGERQAAALASVPDIAQAARVISSPLCRSRQTAAALGPPVTLDERWIEMDYGFLDGCPFDEVPPEVWSGYRSDLEFAPTGGESLASVSRRVRQACQELVEEAGDLDVVVVSHVSPIKAAVAWVLGTSDELVWRLFLDTASVTRVSVRSGDLVLRGFNDTSGRPSE